MLEGVVAIQPTAFPETVSAVLGPIRTLPLTACHKPVDAPHLHQAPQGQALRFMLRAAQRLLVKLSQHGNYTLGDAVTLQVSNLAKVACGPASGLGQLVAGLCSPHRNGAYRQHQYD